jgi:hypothetical protein
MAVDGAVNEWWDLPDCELIVTHEEKIVLAFKALYIMKLD